MTNKLLIIYSIKKILSKNNWKNRRNRKRNKKKHNLDFGYNDEDNYYFEEEEQPVKLKELIEMQNQPVMKILLKK